MNLVSELVITQERLNSISGKYHIPELKMVSENVQKLTGMLRDTAFSMSLIPIENILTRFQRLVRDLGGGLGKKINFSASGTDTELDKTMIDTLIDPLLHIVRNCVDHGLETPDERIKNGKSAEGNIFLSAGYSGANVVITIKDDGRGIDPEKIRRRAIEKKMISSDSKPSSTELYNLLFEPGFSTSDKITEVSGRGVGMDVVNRNITSVRGNAIIESEYGKGTTVTITLPLVLSIIDGLLVQIGDNQYVLPLSVTDKIYSVTNDMLNNKFIDLVTLEGRQVPFINLRKELEIKSYPPERVQLVVIKNSGSEAALSVDRVVGKIQAVLKPLGKLYNNNKLISAATIMGDGSISLVFDIDETIKLIK
ncbi:chemotaxis protein CheA [Marinilabiliaceae bacterium ANBcel2]|nr:chemotaxis protein CheA [Marinilabiliaceae bacterium ANBcel2]